MTQRHTHPKHKTCFIIQKTDYYEEQEINFFAVKKNTSKVKKSKLDLDNTKTQVRYKMRIDSRIIRPFSIRYLLPAFCLTGCVLQTLETTSINPKSMCA